MPVNNKERYGGDIPADDPVRGAMYDSWEWRQIKAAITGYADMSSAAGARVNDVSDPRTLYDAANVFVFVQGVLEHLRESLDRQSKAIAGSGGPWQGPAAQAFLGGVDQYGKLVQAHVDQLTDSPTGSKPVAVELVKAGDRLAKAIADVESIDAWYAAQAQQQGAQVADHGDRGQLVHVSEKPEVVRMMTEDMRKVIKQLHADYTVTTSALRPPPANPDFDLTRDPGSLDPAGFAMDGVQGSGGPAPFPGLPGDPAAFSGSAGIPGSGAIPAPSPQPWPGGQAPGSPADLGLPPDPPAPFDPGTSLAGGLGTPGTTLPGLGGGVPAAWPGSGMPGSGAGSGVPGAGGFPGLLPFPGSAATGSAPGVGAGGVRGFGGADPKGWPGAAERAAAGRLGSAGLAAGTPGAAGGVGGRVLPGAGMPGAGTGGYPPYMPPPMGGAGGAAGAQERERTTWLVEDEDVWGANPDGLAPNVIGRS